MFFYLGLLSVVCSLLTFYGVPLRVGLSALSFSASFLPAQKSLPNFTFPVPESQFPPLLQKDAAPIPNAKNDNKKNRHLNNDSFSYHTDTCIYYEFLINFIFSTRIKFHNFVPIYTSVIQTIIRNKFLGKNIQ